MGVHYGTGRHFADIEDDHITKALEVSNYSKTMQFPLVILEVYSHGLIVLVVLLPLLLPQHDRLEDVHWILPPANHDPKTPQLDHLHGHDVHCLGRSCLLLRDTVPVSPNLVLLE